MSYNDRSGIGANCNLGQNVFVARNVKIGNNVKIRNNVSIYGGVILEDNVFCGPSMVFTNVKTPRSAFPRKTSDDYTKTVVKKGASISANVTVICGVSIGECVLVAAGAVVRCTTYALVAGVPARVTGWACECGDLLKFKGNIACCPECGRQYQSSRENAISLV